MTNLRRRLDRLAARPRHDADRGALAALLGRILPQLTTAELEAMLDPRIAVMSYEQLAAIARGDYSPDWKPTPIPAAVLARLRGLCMNDYERGMLGV